MDRTGQFQDILDLPDLFHCRKANCDIKFAICIGRQKANAQRGGFETMPYPICDDCPQGTENYEMHEPGRKSANPKRGKGQRKQDCKLYEGCLDLAVKRNWRGWNCKVCPLFIGDDSMKTEGTEKSPNTRICEDCKTNVTISPNSPLCPKCMARRSNQDRKPGQKAPERQKAKRGKSGPRQRPGAGKIVRPRGDLEVSISFSQFPDVLEGLKALATREIRPLDLQIIYLLKRSLEP